MLKGKLENAILPWTIGYVLKKWLSMRKNIRNYVKM